MKFNSLFWGQLTSGPYSPYKPCNHSLYIGIIIFPNIDNTGTKRRWVKLRKLYAVSSSKDVVLKLCKIQQITIAERYITDLKGYTYI